MQKVISHSAVIQVMHHSITNAMPAPGSDALLTDPNWIRMITSLAEMYWTKTGDTAGTLDDILSRLRMTDHVAPFKADVAVPLPRYFVRAQDAEDADLKTRETWLNIKKKEDPLRRVMKHIAQQKGKGEEVEEEDEQQEEEEEEEGEGSGSESSVESPVRVQKQHESGSESDESEEETNRKKKKASKKKKDVLATTTVWPIPMQMSAHVNFIHGDAFTDIPHGEYAVVYADIPWGKNKFKGDADWDDAKVAGGIADAFMFSGNHVMRASAACNERIMRADK